MTLCDIADVRRVAGFSADPTPPDATLAAAVEAIESWFTKVSKRDFSTGGTASFYNVKFSDMLTLPADASSIDAVRVSYAIGYEAVWTWYQLVNGNQVQLRAPWTGFYDTEATRATIARVEVDWTASGEVPPAVRDGVAILAGALVRKAKSSTSGMTSEKIGDYAYTLESAADCKSLSPAGYSLLRPFVRRAVRVT
jgi:hypothetical protein